jgi:hypothetical protein
MKYEILIICSKTLSSFFSSIYNIFSFTLSSYIFLKVLGAFFVCNLVGSWYTCNNFLTTSDAVRFETDFAASICSLQNNSSPLGCVI